jgi:glycosyltransferase involved in cell wall biosynthesis
MRLTIVQGAFFPVPPLRGGAVEKVWFALGQEFARRGHVVTHISRAYRGLPHREVIGGVTHKRVRGADATGHVVLDKLQDFIFTLRARRALPEADVIVSNTFWLPILGARRGGGKLYAHVARYPKGQMRWYHKAMRLQAISHAVAKAILKEAPRYASRVRVLPYPAFDVLEALPAATPLPTILYVGRLHEEKGVTILCEAFKKLGATYRDCRLRLVGPWRVEEGGSGGRYLERIRSTLGEQALARTTIEGPVFLPTALSEIYRQAAVFVYPSIAEKGEAFGLSVLEAMSQGCVPIVSALECFADIVENGVSGLVFNHRDQDAANELSGKLEWLFADGANLRSLSSQAWARAKEFNLELVASAYEADMQKVILGE